MSNQGCVQCWEVVKSLRRWRTWPVREDAWYYLFHDAHEKNQALQVPDAGDPRAAGWTPA